MRASERFPDDQAYVEFNDAFVESLEPLTIAQRESLLADVVALCRNPAGAHPLSNRGGQKLAGWNTLDVLQKEYRVVFASRVDVVDGTPVGMIEVLVAGPRRAAAAYDMAAALVRSGRIDPDLMTEVWEVLALVEVVAEEVGLDGWDYRPEPAPPGMVKAAVVAGILDEATATNLSKDELEAAMTHGWDADGNPDPVAALGAAMRRARAGVEPFDLTRVMSGRREPRCGAILRRAKRPCIRREGHPGPHRSS
ncbi:hypothetical protein ACIA03_03045 [Nocardioides sp. NPDC051685]|uniref:hypothetical protein n=1 Tax=Nocardioides sp. NPDC051685 TaxID=3364334 RepID=UPI0037A7554F